MQARTAGTLALVLDLKNRMAAADETRVAGERLLTELHAALEQNAYALATLRAEHLGNAAMVGDIAKHGEILQQLSDRLGLIASVAAVRQPAEPPSARSAPVYLMRVVSRTRDNKPDVIRLEPEKEGG